VTEKSNKAHMEQHKITVGEFREFVRSTAYITDCEKHDSGWIFVRSKWQKKNDATWDNPYVDQDEHDPVVLVSWHDAVIFANWKSGRDGLTKAYSIVLTQYDYIVGVELSASGYRLPTEREWEAATFDSPVALCRPEKPSAQKFKHSDRVFPGARWFGGGSTCDPIEWCWDTSDPAESGASCNHTISGLAEPRICRGASAVRSEGRLEAIRGACDPFSAATTLGFRLVRGA
jgi:formylglycine-generating enzyme required for sulfatase activity